MKIQHKTFCLLSKKLVRDGLSPTDVIYGIALFRTGKLDANYVANKEKINLMDAIIFVLKHRMGAGLRKPFPGFNPVIYSASNGQKISEPTLNYLNDGEPSGPWNLASVPTSLEEAGVSSLKCALHVHVYYPELLPGILEGIAINSNRPTIYLTFPSGHSDAIRKLVTDFDLEFRFIPLNQNIGRDLGPFLTSLPEEFFEKFDVIGHAHTKKSIEFLGADSGNNWFNFMLKTMVGSQISGKKLDDILKEFENNLNLGIVFPDDPNIMGWSQNYDIAKRLFPDFKLPNSFETFEFPMGSFFLARPAAIKPILLLKLTDNDFPTEPVPYDGTTLHAIERLLGVIPKALGFETRGTYAKGVSR